MKKLIALMSVVLALGALVPVAKAGHTSRVCGYNRCGDAVYEHRHYVGRDRCGNPVYRWVRHGGSGCTRPGRCSHHGHARTVYTTPHAAHYRRTAPRISFSFGGGHIRSSYSSHRSSPRRGYSRCR